MNSVPNNESKDDLAKRVLEKIAEKPDLLDVIRERMENDEIVDQEAGADEHHR